MSDAIEDYAVLSNTRTAALVSHDGSIDWFCAPRYDSPSIFGAVLGDESHGSWRLRPAHADATVTRRYDGDTFILVTRWEAPTGVVEVHDLLPIRTRRLDIVRRIVGVSGTVELETQLRIRFDYARSIPWVRQTGTPEAPALRAVAGPAAVVVRGIALEPVDHAHQAAVTVSAGEQVDLTLSWWPSYLDEPGPLDVDEAIAETRDWWVRWAEPAQAHGAHRELVMRSLLVLRALTYEYTGGIIAAATTSLPEQFGGARNWDYRYVWLRDASLTLEALLSHGYVHIAEGWRAWLLRALAGDPSQMQIMYGIAGERDLPERELTSLPGYRGASPVRVGNGAVDQYQADVVGEVMVALEAARLAGLAEDDESWALQRALLERVEIDIDRPDNGIWEIRSTPRVFTQSRVMMWAAFDRGVRAAEDFGLEGPVERWRVLRDGLRDEIVGQGIDPKGGYFVQAYGSDEVDASLLLLPQVGFCAADDPRMLATVAEIERTLVHDGFVHRYRTSSGVDGLSGAEHPFLACTFWLVEQYAASGRTEQARRTMRRACEAANDLGLLSEEYDPVNRRQAGNTPQALSHLALVRAADAIEGESGRGAHRRSDPAPQV